MIDFHTHILPGVDDGSRNVKESLEILREEGKLGVDTVVLTPHYYAQECSPRRFLERRHNAMQQLEPHLTSEIPRLILGAEVHYFEGICAVRELEKLRIEGTSLLLLEMPMRRWTERMLSDVVELNRRPGFRVVLAHIERYLDQQPKKTLENLLAAGVLMQSNVSFFSHWRTRYKALSMMENGQIHMLGSDCHSMGTRRPNWDQLPERAKSLISSGKRIYLRQRLSENPTENRLNVEVR